MAKTKERAARNAQRKIGRLAQKLSETGKLTDWEEEFTESVGERLDKFGSAFQDPEKGRPADALSFAQKKVVAALNKKAKGDKAQKTKTDKTRKGFKSKNGFKKKSKFQPRVRDIHEDVPEEEIAVVDSEPFIPEIPPSDKKPPFLRVVK